MYRIGSLLWSTRASGRLCKADTAGALDDLAAWLPGAPAVILYREEVTNDDLHSVQHYQRIKILTDEGKRYANVELGFVSQTGDGFFYGDDLTVEQITDRTIHPDGTIIPFTGKPYLKVLVKANGYKVQEKVFTLPDVEAGSIVEYRYFTRFSDQIVKAPTWMVQDELFVKEAHFAWLPTQRSVSDEQQRPINAIAWFPILPPGATLESHDIPSTNRAQVPARLLELHVKDVPPVDHEDDMPPLGSYSYRVNFSLTAFRSRDEYWRETGKQWSKLTNNFAGPNNALRDATAKVTAGANTPEDKLHKIYAAVMSLENTAFTRERDQREDKAAGVAQVNNASDVLARGRGTPAELAELFLGMARAAGFNAYMMWVPDRSQNLFTSQWLSTRQLDDYLVIVNLNGKHLLRPGLPLLCLRQLAWQHTLVGGLRQIEGGTALGQTSASTYKDNGVFRTANLTMGADGVVQGTVDLSFKGAPALH